MVDREKRKRGQRVFWGVLLIAVGVILMLDRLGVIEIGNYGIAWWYWWPVVLIVIGLASLVSPESLKQAGNGLSMTLMGFWALACTQHWYGLSYRRGWPIVLVIFGLESVLVAMLERRSAAAEKEAQHV